MAGEHRDEDGSGSRPAVPARTPGRGTLPLLVTPIIVLVVINNIGNALFPTLSTENPLLLIAMSPPNRNLVIAAAQVDFPAYFAVGFLRLLAPDPFFFLLGTFYGDQAVRWMEHRTPTFGRMMRQLEGLFARWGHALVLIMPNNPVCLLAGAARMRPRVFWALNVVGTIGRLLLMAWIGVTFTAAIDAVLDWISRYRTPLLVVSIGIVAFTAVREVRAGTSEVQQLLLLEETLEEEAEADAGPDPDGAA